MSQKASYSLKILVKKKKKRGENWQLELVVACTSLFLVSYCSFFFPPHLGENAKVFTLTLTTRNFL